ncbi:Carbon monoxide dehydrogenase small chain [Ensifer psoraleae]|uniref:(2Fe-2S)-binding protein n=1 Tax=Sinorhizobium psoraleae TaxID=520838 RepID=UPI0015691ED3|nr:(2Fe-2S)-binding protein [Sinorhizobium psoraleae]NRP72147.1 Carbon monoxide dehydrogenase small chain [Sinorhizobium psoraleae]
MVPLSLTVNGKPIEVEVEARTLMVDLLRNTLGLTGTHIGCDTSQCGACVVHVNGRTIKSCSVLAVACDGEEITTIEGLACDDGRLHPMQQAFADCHGLQCGYCTPGMIMTAVAIADEEDLLEPARLREELHGNLCRCTGYQNIVKAVIAGADAMKRSG